MKNILFVCAVALVTLCLSCASTEKVTLDSTKRTPTTQLDILRVDENPKKPVKRIAELTFLGLPEEETKATRQFVEEAKKLGADALVMGLPKKAGLRRRFGHNSPLGIPHLVFNATAVVYE